MLHAPFAAEQNVLHFQTNPQKNRSTWLLINNTNCPCQWLESSPCKQFWNFVFIFIFLLLRASFSLTNDPSWWSIVTEYWTNKEQLLERNMVWASFKKQKRECHLTEPWWLRSLVNHASYQRSRLRVQVCLHLKLSFQFSS